MTRADARLWAPTERERAEPETRKSSRPRTRTRTLTAMPSERVSCFTLKVELAFKALRQLEDKWLNAFGGKEERLPLAENCRMTDSRMKGDAGEYKPSPHKRYTVLNRVYQGKTLPQWAVTAPVIILYWELLLNYYSKTVVTSRPITVIKRILL